MAKVIRDALDGLKAVLDGLTITTPAEQTLKAVYEPPIAAGVLDVPSVIIYPPGLPKNDAPSQGLAMLQYRVPLRIVVSEEKLEESGEYVLAWAEAVRAKLCDKSDLNGTCDGVLGMTYDRAENWKLGKRNFVVVDAEIPLNIEELRTYGV